jgi:hypothetical protein
MATPYVVNIRGVLEGLRALSNYDINTTDTSVLTRDVTLARTIATQILALPERQHRELEDELNIANDTILHLEENLATKEAQLRNTQQLLDQTLAINRQYATAPPANTTAIVNNSRFPDAPMFSGGKPEDLRAFKTQLRLKIASQPSQFPDEQSRLRYAFSRLEGPALALVNTYLRDDNTIGFDTLNAFLAHLDLAYDDPDRAGTAERELQRLYQKNRLFSLYYADFQRVISDLDYNESAKLAALRRGLCDEIKDTLRVTMNEPTTFTGFVALCQQIDNKNRAYAAEKPTSRNTTPRTTHQATASRNAPTTPTPNRSAAHPTNTNSGHYGPAPMNLSANRRTLSPEERQRRMDLNLCFYCAGNDHITRNCPVRPTARRPLRGAAVELQPAEETATSDSQESGNA